MIILCMFDSSVDMWLRKTVVISVIFRKLCNIFLFCYSCWLWLIWLMLWYFYWNLFVKNNNTYRKNNCYFEGRRQIKTIVLRNWGVMFLSLMTVFNWFWQVLTGSASVWLGAGHWAWSPELRDKIWTICVQRLAMFDKPVSYKPTYHLPTKVQQSIRLST